MHRVCAARKLRSFARVMRLRNSTCPAPSAPCTWNTCFAMSKPIVLTCSTDASFGGSSTPPLWHADAVGGRPPHHPTEPVPRRPRRSLVGHFEQFPATSTSVGYLLGQETVAGATPDGRSAPIPAVRQTGNGTAR